MNQQYFHKKGPPKLIKDIKCGKKPHLTQSLLDYTEIQNLQKIFKGKKNQYKVEEKKIDIKKEEEEEVEIKEINFLSPEENLENIKKQRQSNLMKDKMSSMFKEKEVRKYKMRKPVLYHMLEDFKSSYRVEEPPKFREALKASELNLSHIKINNRKKISSEYIRDKTSCSRPKFVSILSGKPTVNKNYFPSFEDFIQGKFTKTQEENTGINFSRLNSELMITEPPVEKSSPLRKGKRKDSLDVSFRILSNAFRPSTTKTAFQRSKTQSSYTNPNSTFIKSEESSKKIINTMTNYYSKKKEKTTQCDQMVSYLKKDRPLTSQIRRKNYRLVGKDELDDLYKYREKSEQERVQLLKDNHGFYLKMLKIFEHQREEEIPMTIRVLKKLKEFFESEYILFEDNVRQMFSEAQSVPDIGIDVLKSHLMEYARERKFEFQTENEEEYQIL